MTTFLNSPVTEPTIAGGSPLLRAGGELSKEGVAKGRKSTPREGGDSVCGVVGSHSGRLLALGLGLLGLEPLGFQDTQLPNTRIWNFISPLGDRTTSDAEHFRERFRASCELDGLLRLHAATLAD